MDGPFALVYCSYDNRTWLSFHCHQNFADFVWCVEFAMTPIARTEEDLWNLCKRIVKFLTGFDQIYVGNNPENNHRACLCVFQMIHIPVHIEWNGSIRTGSQATVERTIGEMGQKIRSCQLPFSNLTNLIIDQERIHILGLYYPDLQTLVRPCVLDTTSLNPVNNLNIKATCPIQINLKTQTQPHSASSRLCLQRLAY